MAESEEELKKPVDERGEWKSWPKAQHSKRKIMASGPITSWETVETKHESRSSEGNNHGAEQAGIKQLSRQYSRIWSRRNHAGQQAIIKKLSRQESRNLSGNNHGAQGCNEVDKRTLNTWLSRLLSRDWADRNHAAQQAIIMEMSKQESRSSAGNNHGVEQAGITQVSMQ